MISTHDEIKRLSYIKWIAAGCPEDRDAEFWLEAEKEIIRIRREMDKLNPFQKASCLI